jgi:hypothetical protein
MIFMLTALLLTVLIFSRVDANGDKLSLRRRELSSRNLQKLTRLELYNAKTDKKISDLIDGQVIDIQSIAGLTSPSFNINAVVQGSVSSVTFGYNNTFRTDRASPYAFCGDTASNFKICQELGYGSHTITVTTSPASTTTTITFRIINTAIPMSPPVPTSVNAPVPTPVKVSLPTPIKAPIHAPVPVSVPSVFTSGVTGLRLMYTGVDPSVPVVNLTFNSINVVDLQVLSLPSAQFSIDAIVGTDTQSVIFSNGRIETAAPLAYCGNSGNTFYACGDLVLGANITVTVTAYSDKNGNGVVIGTRSVTINIVRTLPPAALTPPTVAPVRAPTRPPVPGCPVPRVRGTS